MRKVSYKYLSHRLDNVIPVYRGSASLNISQIKSISEGDTTNSYRSILESHWGTHVDAPNHFFNNGEKIVDYPPEFWFFKSPEVIQITLNPSEILACDKWIESIRPDSDILLLQSGWGKFRGHDEYSLKNPGLHPDVGFFLRRRYPNLRAIGIDWISISSYQNRMLGREAHKAFLDPAGKNNPVLIIEDMELRSDLNSLKEIIVVPLIIDGFDSAPCTVIGKFHD